MSLVPYGTSLVPWAYGTSLVPYGTTLVPCACLRAPVGPCVHSCGPLCALVCALVCTRVGPCVHPCVHSYGPLCALVWALVCPRVGPCVHSCVPPLHVLLCHPCAPYAPYAPYAPCAYSCTFLHFCSPAPPMPSCILHSWNLCINMDCRISGVQNIAAYRCT